MQRSFAWNSADRRLLIVLFALAAGLFFWRTGYYGGWNMDFTSLVERSYRVAMGQVMYRDFHCFISPLTYHIQAVLLRLFDHTLWGMRYYVALQGALMAAASWVLSRRVLGLGRRLSLWVFLISVAWSTPIVNPIPWYTTDAYFFILAGLGSLMGGWGRLGAWPAALAGACFGMSYLAKQDLGAAAVSLGTLCFFAQNQGPERGKRAIFYTAGLVAPVFLFVGYMAYHGALRDAVYWTIQRAFFFRFDSSQTGLIEKIGLTAYSHRSQMGRLLFMVYLLGVLCPLRAYFSKTADDAQSRFFSLRDSCASLIPAGVFYAGFLTHDAAYFENLQALLWLPAGILFKTLGWPGKRGRTFDRVLVVWVFLLIAFSTIYSLKYIRMSFAIADFQFAALDDPRFAGIKLPFRTVQKTRRLKRFIEARIPAGQSFVIIPPDQSHDRYFAMERLPPQPYTSNDEYRPEDDAGIIAEMERNKPCWVILWMGDWGRLARTKEYILRHYAPSGREEGLIGLFRRRGPGCR